MNRIATVALWVAAFAVPLESQVRVIAVDETVFPEDLTGLGAKHVLFDSLIIAELTTAGFTVIRPALTAAAWRAARDSLGGYYDPFTGRVVKERLLAVRTATLLALRQEFHVDAWMRPAIVRVSATTSDRTAKWNGIAESTGEGLLGGHGGTFPALSLSVDVLDSTGKSAYAALGGIQLTMNAFRVFAPESLLQNRARIVRAVHLTLDSLPAALLRIRH